MRDYLLDDKKKNEDIYNNVAKLIGVFESKYKNYTIE
jgi:hypothetical protein